MARYELIIGNMNYSSWSMRGGLVLAASNADWQQTMIPLRQPDTETKIRHYSPTGKLPCLIDHTVKNPSGNGGLAIWDSLAIAEYLAETHPNAALWPSDPAARAIARAVTAEMHSGFTALRSQFPMNIRRRVSGAVASPESLKEITRICQIWHHCRQEFAGKGKFLFGTAPTIADWFYAPIVTRFITYNIEMDDSARDYVANLVTHPVMARWLANATAETISIPYYDEWKP
ncbi:MAG: glutathione S-transferase family protein [Alphaproteobacteria bacterium]|nr:glutathione S-transferase family protein [Alphaproteobacteria bacterium]